ncbi:MAG TPA: cyclase family protein [Candidatus Acidoferrales bacterium]|nr:cyclase family protein [Candidatus Acidoferrales bacterium]
MYDRWHGWREPSAPLVRGGGAWQELSHPLRADLARISFFPEARFRRIMSMPKDPLNVTEIQMVCHFGTHVDAPCHFIPDGPAFHEIPLDRLYGPGVVWRLRCEPYGLIEPEMLEQAGPPLRPDDVLILDTGWAAHFGTELYDQNPSLSLAAAEWLVEHGVKLIGVDFATPDLAVNRRPPGFRWPVHHVLLSQGVLIGENLTNLGPLVGRRVEVMFLALNITGADGAPARVIARPTDA